MRRSWQSGSAHCSPRTRSISLLLDTHALLWFGFGDNRLPRALRQRLASERVYVSEISRCEIVVKEQARRRALGIDVDRVMEKAGFQGLPLSYGVHRKLEELPLHHRDPFDRLLIAQALCDGLTLVTRDRNIRRYDLPVAW